jgi:DNA-binding XRE family transcriptional regulator
MSSPLIFIADIFLAPISEDGSQLLSTLGALMKPKPLVKQVGQAIARPRKLVKLTQAQVAKKLGIEVETVSRMETGVISLTLERLDQLSQLYDCPVSAFFCIDSHETQILSVYLADLIQPLSWVTISHIR